jgi:endonuclease/exonuclease/phosphatase family metal-dependent hydrolase
MRKPTSIMLAAAALMAVSAPAAADPPDRELSVATYNIHHGAGVDNRLDLERIAREIRRGGADVVGLQEVDRHWSERSELVDQARRLGKRLHMHVAYAANLDLDPLEPGLPRRQYGTAVLSRFPILSSRNTLLPRPLGGEQRGLLETVLNVRGVRVRFANTHLQHNSAEERLAQTERIAELLAGAEEPTVLVGDLNATPEAPELAPLRPLFEDAGASAGNTFPAAAPDRRIDYVLVTPDVDARGAEVLASPASDHLQLTAALAVPAFRPGAQTLAVIGDTPYGDEQVAAFPGLVEDVNADPKVRLVMHLGDIKNGSSTCTTERFRSLRALYDTFRDPFVYTPGDNEWTDCHRPAQGGYLPLERLDVLRRVFFPRPGVTTGGRPQRVLTQAADRRHREYVENVRWTESKVTFAAVHVVGSANDLEPWFGAAETSEQRSERLGEFDRRLAADLDWLDETFAAAEADGSRGVVIGMQADTIAGTRTGFAAINERVEQLASRFSRPVLLLQGDTHSYVVDRPFPTAPNLTRVVVEGETAGEWLRLTVDPRSREVFSWTREAVVGPSKHGVESAGADSIASSLREHRGGVDLLAFSG